MLSISQAFKKILSQLENYSETPKLDAEYLIHFVSEITKEKIISHPEMLLSLAQEKLLENLVRRRIQGEPIAYLIGSQEFWSLEFTVTQDTLIPRPDTECLVEWILKKFNVQKKILAADLGTGTGAIALSLGHEKPNWKIHATDFNENTLTIAKLNAKKFANQNVEFFRGNWCEALPKKNYDFIVSNPPYIPENDPHLKALQFEPQAALISGKEGLDDIKIIAQSAREYLKPGGFLILEHGFNQAEAVKKLLESLDYNEISSFQDFAGNWRFTVGAIRSGREPLRGD